MKKNIKILIVIAIILISIITTIYYTTKGIVADVYNINRGYANYYFTEEGVIGNTEYYNQFSKNSGDVVEVNVKIGDTIKKGDTIARIKNTSLDFEISSVTQQINGYKSQIDNIYTQDKSRINTINSSIADLNSQLATLEVNKTSGNISKNEQLEIQQLLISQNEKDLQNLLSDLQKYKVLLSEGIIAQAEYDSLNEQITATENLLEQNKKQLNIIETGSLNSNDEYIESTKKALNVQINNLKKELQTDYITPNIQYQNSLIKIAESHLALLSEQKNDLTIKSNVSGTISELPIINTNFVTNISPIAIIKQESLLIESYISTRDIDSIRIGNTVNIIIDKRQGEETYEGIIHFIDSEAKLEISSLGLEERKIKVLIEPSENLNLVSGFNVDIQYLLYENDDVITVPKESIFKYDDGYAVYKIINNKATITPIKKGIELRETTVIESGLSANDIIILDANEEDIKDGVKITY